MNPLEELLSSDARNAVAYTFECMTIAEEEIARAKRKYPRKAKRAHAAFKVLCPPASLRGFSKELYRAYAAELVERAVRGEDTRLGTKAEILGMMSVTSAAAPFNSIGFALAMRLFKDLYPQVKHDELPAEPWQGACDEKFRELQSKTSDEGRML